MLKALYDYAVREQLVLPPGYTRKSIRAYVSLAQDGTFRGILPGNEEKVPCPDIGSMANSGDKCNVLAARRSILFPHDAEPAGDGKKSEREANAAKTAYFCQTMADAAKEDPHLTFCLHAMQDPETAAAVLAKLDQMKVRASAVVSFMIDGRSILERPGVVRWWEQFRRQFAPDPAKKQKVPCLITGRLTVPMKTVPPISGLSVVGGHASGDALICFDKDAFCSYGLKQAANAPVSEEAFAGVKAALDDLLADAPILAGMKFVHWYDKPLETGEDSLSRIFGDIPLEEDGGDDTTAVNAHAARRQADDLIGSVKTGRPVHELPNQYYILLLSGVGGRVMIRAYQQGNYRQLTENLRQWESDLDLIYSSGTGLTKPVKLSARLIRLIARQNSDKKVFERLAKELAGLTPAIVHAILDDRPLPDAVISRALAYIRSQMFRSSEEEQTHKVPVPDPWACQWLKAWLCRWERTLYKKEELTVEYNANHPEAAYHCGALVAVYGAIQNAAMPDVNASLIDRYYAAASQTPALVLGQLARMSNYHLAKLERLKTYFGDLRDRVACAIGDNIPTVLRPEQQAYFALGYYQMCAKLEQDRQTREAAAAAKANA